MSLGERIRKQRERIGLSQSELGRRLRIAQPTLSDIERGKQPDVTSALLKRLARALGCTTDYLVGMHEDEEGEPLAAAVAQRCAGDYQGGRASLCCADSDTCLS